jgi:hypothetical protein
VIPDATPQAFHKAHRYAEGVSHSKPSGRRASRRTLG